MCVHSCDHASCGWDVRKWCLSRYLCVHVCVCAYVCLCLCQSLGGPGRGEAGRAPRTPPGHSWMRVRRPPAPAARPLPPAIGGANKALATGAR